MITLHDIQAYLGAPPAPRCETYQRRAGALILWAWRDATFGAKDGWWCAVTYGDILLEAAWEMGGTDERDRSLAAMAARHPELAEIEAAA